MDSPREQLADAKVTPLRGTFVDLRPLTPEDAENTFRWRQSDRARLLNRGAETVEAQRRWIEGRPQNELNFIIQLKDGTPVGMLSAVAIDFVHRHAEPARFLVGEPERVHGIPVAAEAMKMLYELLFDRLGLERVYGTVAAKNGLMIGWQKYLGMKEEGRLRRHLFLNGEFQDSVCLGMLKEEYEKGSLPRLTALVESARHGR